MPSIFDISNMNGLNNKKLSSKLTFDVGERFAGRIISFNGEKTQVNIKLLDGWKFEAELDEAIEDFEQGLLRFEVEGFENGKLKLKVIHGNIDENSNNDLIEAFIKKECLEEGDREFLMKMIKHEIPLTRENISKFKSFIDFHNKINLNSGEIEKFIEKYLSSKGIKLTSTEGQKVQNILKEFLESFKNMSKEDVFIFLENDIDLSKANLTSFNKLFRSDGGIFKDIKNLKESLSVILKNAGNEILLESSNNLIGNDISDKSLEGVKNIDNKKVLINEEIDAKGINNYEKIMEDEFKNKEIFEKNNINAKNKININNNDDIESYNNDKTDIEGLGDYKLHLEGKSNNGETKLNEKIQDNKGIDENTINKKILNTKDIDEIKNKGEIVLNYNNIKSEVLKNVYSSSNNFKVNILQVLKALESNENDIIKHVIQSNLDKNYKIDKNTFLNLDDKEILIELKKIANGDDKKGLLDLNKSEIEKGISNVLGKDIKLSNSQFKKIYSAIKSLVDSKAIFEADSESLIDVNLSEADNTLDIKDKKGELNTGNLEKNKDLNKCAKDIIKQQIEEKNSEIKGLIKDILKVITKEDKELNTKIFNAIKNNINDFKMLNSMSNDYYYMNLPVDLRDKEYPCKLIIKDGRKDGKKLDSTDIKMIVSVKTINLGVIDGYLSVKNKNLNVDLKCDGDILKIVDAGKTKLKNTLEKLGFITNILVRQKDKESDIISYIEFFNESHMQVIDRIV